MSNFVGRLQVGKLADINVTGGPPLVNIDELLNVDFLMKGGKVFVAGTVFKAEALSILI